MTLGPDGNLYVSGADLFDMKGGIHKIDGKTGADLGVFIAPSDAGLRHAFDLTFGPDGNLYVSNWGGAKVMRFDGSSGEYLGDFVKEGSGGLKGTMGIVFGPDHNLYVSCETTHRVLKYDGRSGGFLGEFVSAGAGGLSGPGGLAFGPDGSLYVCSRQSHSVLRYNGQTGAFIDVFIQPGSGGLDNGPNYIAFSPRLPSLTITQSNDGTLVTWPETGLKCVLETASSLSGDWEAVTNSPGDTAAAGRVATQPAQPGEQRFFRLRQTE
jgi:DNA-binding beta-propeller fold protein YncE